MTNSFKEESKKLTVSVVDGTDHNLDAEGMAMLSALTSRSQDGPKANLALVEEKGAAAFMEKFYIGYGHGSIGKCGTTNVFISGISMLAINYLQNLNPLYVGQESSTRYIPFESEGVYLPESMEEKFRPEMDRLMKVYEDAQPWVKEHLLANVPKPDGVTDSVWDRTINARVFDICRSILPAGCKTVGCWNGNLENFRQVLTIALHSVNTEVVSVADEIYTSLQERYPSSFPEIVLTPAQEVWYRHLAARNTFDSEPNDGPEYVEYDEGLSAPAITWLERMPYRPKYAPLPDSSGALGRITFGFTVDFGGFRDINRHRKGNCLRGILDINSDINEWYLSQMPSGVVDMFKDAIDSIRNVVGSTDDLSCTDIEYIVPMGTNVSVVASYPLDNAIYLSELRSGPTVHPTVRKVAQEMGAELFKGVVGKHIELYHNMDDVDGLDVRRANQDIFDKEA